MLTMYLRLRYFSVVKNAKLMVENYIYNLK